uniref:Uncharacterized protein LOC111122285 isoform X2 n=1 Tax=Crassostrea virginica TaxID=6565 RepID=A0A8B8CUV4_CRAVI|nr:uncharacterized protein LOC111122285 isoform X2 [Crassostrea virginica]
MPPKKKPQITRALTPAPKNRSKRTARNQEPILDSIGTVNVQAQTQAVQSPETASTQVPHQVDDVVTCATTSSLDQRGDAGLAEVQGIGAHCKVVPRKTASGRVHACRMPWSQYTQTDEVGVGGHY